ncbi:ferrous iron transport protein B [Anaerotalea alkaliphila]|uniref:Ferrous iron transport protein B n=1 Tax=Anaerotalea alkaliphila TaxID=2662126 RepID=A0A7X5HVF9_9FIRM|nr:ferrous iron transport protein B [Anaerotalea alkaliphila]NDL67365.1 ferrous iron transport protein B [Anaerotalea alkaliphila]
MNTIKVALIGNPNCGKTTLFNAYTGAKHKVGNWPGVTVEKREGLLHHDGNHITLVDLPGIYSISPYSLEEKLTQEYILNYDPDVIVNVVDASNLERNLYLTAQLLEMGKPVVLALTMVDVLEARRITLNTDKLSKALGVDVVPVTALRNLGLKNLLHTVIRRSKAKEVQEPPGIPYGELEEAIAQVESLLPVQEGVEERFRRWIAIKLLEGDGSILQKVETPELKALLEKLAASGVHYEEELAIKKYGHVQEIVPQVLEGDEGREILSDRIDRILTHELLGIPIFLAMMGLVFVFTFTVGNHFAGLMEGFFGFAGSFVTSRFGAWGVAEWMTSLVVDGIIGGVGGILIFLPNIAALFVAMSLMEDSGYMARIALIMDKIMRRFGLSGKAFIPMILGFGCSVPAIMTARTLEDERDRLATIMVTPFMSCSARFPIYVLFSRAFFPGREILVTLTLYVLGILVAVLTALLFKRTLAKGEKGALILELPNYKLPSWKTTGIFVWEKVRGYIVRAGTIIFIASIFLWFILEYNFSGKAEMSASIGASIGKAIAPAFSPMGFGTWEAALALLAGIMGKEIVVSSMAVIYGIGEGSLSAVLSQVGFTPASAYAFMVFALLYTACLATLGVIKKETNSWRWMFFAFGYQLGVAWVVSALIYQVIGLFA